MKLWEHVTLQSLEAAMSMIDQHGHHPVRWDLGFRPANTLHVYLDERGPYEARVLLALAARHQFPGQQVTPIDFKGCKEHNFLVDKFGFERRNINNQ